MTEGALQPAYKPWDVATDSPDSMPPSFWPTHPAKLGEAPNDLFVPDFGLPADGKPSKHYHYPDAVFSNNISTSTREFLRACWTDADKVKEYLHAGIDVHQANANGFTGLHMAASKFKLDCAEVLVEAGHDPNIEDCNGLTPLDYCIDNGLYGEAGVWSERNGNRHYIAMVEYLESVGGLRKQERCWLSAANVERYAPNAARGGKTEAASAPAPPAGR
mmetsp:Transcript_82625/g.234075  ORF Transcript_82625/g.234075 Transcript_82625/m.234075 type:complete len:218 (-) Transcript_82625:83-736(-)